MLKCPICQILMSKVNISGSTLWNCPSCKGRIAPLSFLRSVIPRDLVNTFWQEARTSSANSDRNCPSCKNKMTVVRAPCNTQNEILDICIACQSVWFDAGEYEALPQIVTRKSVEKELSPEAKERVANLELQSRQEKMKLEMDDNPPEEWWKEVLAAFHIPFEEDVSEVKQDPWVTRRLAILISIISLLALLDLENIVHTLGFYPEMYHKFWGLTNISSFFIHHNIICLAINIYFLLIFGDNVEECLGRFRFILLIICSVLAGNLIDVLYNPYSDLYNLGASTGITGIISFYVLKFPKNKLGLYIGAYEFGKFIRLPTYYFFIVWLLIQVLDLSTVFTGISFGSGNAHLGAAGIGLLFWFFTRAE
jgi:membrane associated rhomboid family serine protease